jgi:hypothetical protein
MINSVASSSVSGADAAGDRLRIAIAQTEVSLDPRTNGSEIRIKCGVLRMRARG